MEIMKYGMDITGAYTLCASDGILMSPVHCVNVSLSIKVSYSLGTVHHNQQLSYLFLLLTLQYTMVTSSERFG